MRRLTFKGFLARYLRELSGQRSLRIPLLVALAEKENPRLREPLFLYAAITGRTDRLMAEVENEALRAEYEKVLPEGDIEELLKHESQRLPERYRKVFQSYKSIVGQTATENKTKLLMWQKTKKLQGEKQLSNYRVYTDLQLNPGNANRFLKHGDTSKVSLDVARRMLRYVEEI